jgi:GAF domain-containing protein
MRALVDAVRDFTYSIVNPYDLEAVLDRLTDQAATVLVAAGVGIMLEDRDGHLRFAAASNETITQAERHQGHLREGVCYEAFRTQQTVAVPDLRATRRWPAYRARVMELGLQAVLGAPMNAHGQTIGVLNVYRDEASSWTGDDIDATEILAAMGAAYILHANQLRATRQLADQLQGALDSRVMIERAKGILMERTGVDAATAFETLRAASMQANRRLRDIATELVERTEPT